MRYGGSPPWMFAALCVLSVGFLASPARIEAQTLGGITGTVTGTVGTVTGTGTGIISGTATVLGGTGLLAAGSTDSLFNEADSISTSLVSADIPRARVIGYADEVVSKSYLASLSLVVGGYTITADSAEAGARAPLDASWSNGTSYVANLSINGMPVLVTGDPNQTIGDAGAMLIINEQQTLPDGTVVVNALHAIVTGVADVVVGSATAGPSGGNASAVQATTF
jgi:hypothetical protein